MFKFLTRSKPTETETEIANLKKELENCRFLINRNDTMFNMSTDENLIASQIYERESLRWQYCYLLGQLKAKEDEKAKAEVTAAAANSKAEAANANLNTKAVKVGEY